VEISFFWSARAVNSSTTARVPVLTIFRKEEPRLAVSDASTGELEDQSDANLIRRVSDGDKEALSLLFRGYARLVKEFSEIKAKRRISFRKSSFISTARVAYSTRERGRHALGSSRLLIPRHSSADAN
jgi:hypothetical protein